MLLAGACAFAIALFSSSSGFAQGVTTAGLAGFVTGTDGHPIAGATVTALHVPTGTRAVTHTNSVGQYVFAGLRPGGPYTVSATAPNMAPANQENLSLDGGTVGKADLTLTAEIVQMSAVHVNAEQDPTFSNMSMSQATTFNAAQIMQIETVRRDIQDVQNLDPRATVMQVSPTDSQYTVSFAGFNPKENLFLIDGVSANDNFGLNSNGYAGFRSPAPPEWIQSMFMDLNPYDLIYSGFAGAVTNLTIKSGTNEFHGDFYALYTGTNFRGPDPAPGPLGKHEKVQEHTTGGTLGGPIIKDKLFFFVGYDAFRELAAPAPAEFIPDSSATGIGAINQIITHTEQTFGFNPGGLVAQTHIWNQDFVAKLDWNITDAHKFEFTFRHTDGEAPNFYNYAFNNETSLSSSWYNTHRTDQSYTAKLESDWSAVVPNLSTEVEATYARYNGTAELNGADFPAVSIGGITGTSTAGGTAPYELFLGQYWAYQLNNIYTWEQEEHAYAQYTMGAHTLKFGVQFDRVGYTDTFIPNALGSYYFATVQDYIAGTPTFVEQETPQTGYNLGSDVSHYYNLNIAPFIEDTWRPNDALTIMGGVRLDYPYEPQSPDYSSLFFSNFGFANNGTGSGNYILSPRVAFNYTLPTERKTQIHGGLGLIASDYPVVWYENSFNNAGQLNTVSSGSTSFVPTTKTLTFNNNPYIFNGVNSPSLIAAGAPPSSAAPSFDVMDPKFQGPSNWKENIAVDHELPFWHIVATVDADFSEVNKDVLMEQLNYATAASAGEAGPAYLPDGAIRYAGNITAGSSTYLSGNYGSAYTSSSSPTYIFAATTSTASSTLQQHKSVGPVYYLTNTDKGGSQVYSIDFHREMKDGWAWSIGYAHTHATVVDDAPSTTASTGYSDIYGVNPNDNVAYHSQYAEPDKVVATLTKRFDFFHNVHARTEISAQYIAETGQAYSAVFKGDANGDGENDSSLFYVPTGSNDPKVAWASSTDEANFFSWLARNPQIGQYAGRVVPRNALYAPWIHLLNLHVEQGVPIWGPAHLILFADCFDFGNLLNHNWGLVSNFDSSFNVQTIAGTGFNPKGDGGAGQYIYVFNPSTLGTPTTYPDMSRWAIQIGARLEF